MASRALVVRWLVAGAIVAWPLPVAPAIHALVPAQWVTGPRAPVVGAAHHASGARGLARALLDATTPCRASDAIPVVTHALEVQP